jgi:hypothetical protein
VVQPGTLSLAARLHFFHFFVLLRSASSVP